MFSAQTPIRVDRRFRDFDVGIATGGTVSTAYRFITSPLTVPTKWEFKENMPEDVAAARHEAWFGEASAAGEVRQ